MASGSSSGLNVQSHCEFYVRFFYYVKSTMKAKNLLKNWWKLRSQDVYELDEQHSKLYEIPRH